MNCDIIIPVWNQRHFTEDCVNSIIKNTDGDYGIIIIDNASDPETKEYLDNLKAINKPSINVIRNNQNLGFIKAVNQGISLSKARYVCVLNNDTLVFKDWLKIMIDIAGKDEKIGIVNPSSNNLGQRPPKGEPIDLYARGLLAEKDKFVELGAAIGFCMLIKRELIDKIGVFDEIFGMGNFEDTDYSRRAAKDGFLVVRACGAYVYHRENTSFKKVSTFDEDFKRNKEIYEFRWGCPKRVAYILDSCDENALEKLNIESVKLAREGNWVWYYFKDEFNAPAHSNIILSKIPCKNFYLKAAFQVLKKKKKFDEIFVSSESFGRVLEALSFSHKARVGYF